MAGPTPKDPKLRQRRNKHSTAATLVDENPVLDIPELPRRRDSNGKFKPDWRAEVKAWWNDVWTSPMAGEYVRSDIHGLFILADLLDQYWRDPSPKLATEIRLQRQCFGLTPIDRRRLQWEVERAESASARTENRKARRSDTTDPRKVLGVVK